MPVWFCAYCSHWHPRELRFCQYCGRAPDGRICRQCKAKVPNEARFCAQCGSDRLTQPATRGFRVSRPIRLLFATAGGLATWALGSWVKRWATPMAVAAWTSLTRLAGQVAVAILAFWLVTGLLPQGWGSRIRALAWAVIRFLSRFCVKLVR